jgi:hypothetical protein
LKSDATEPLHAANAASYSARRKGVKAGERIGTRRDNRAVPEPQGFAEREQMLADPEPVIGPAFGWTRWRLAMMISKPVELPFNENNACAAVVVVATPIHINPEHLRWHLFP